MIQAYKYSWKPEIGLTNKVVAYLWDALSISIDSYTVVDGSNALIEVH